MSINLLSSLRRGRGQKPVDYEWGASKLLQALDIEKLTRAQLRQHLEARDLATNGTKRLMTERLQASLEGERLQAVAYSEQLASEFTLNKDIEERGCVYAVGSNHGGQLAQGDLEPRNVFCAVSKTRGLAVVKVATNGDTLCFALTADHEVLVWGGGGAGATGIKDEEAYLVHKANKAVAPASFVEPNFVNDLAGEEATNLAAGASHCVAVTSGGDLFSWGHNLCGQLGLADLKTRQSPEILLFFEQEPELSVTAIECGEANCAALTQTGQVYTWGHVDSGRLGLGVDERLGARKNEKFYFPAPTLVSKLNGFVIRQIACGSMHTLALAPNKVFAWGHGAGGRLGCGDSRNRIEPVSILELEDTCVLEVAASTWTSGALVLVPPLRDTGWVHMWGSGYQGQLGLGTNLVQLKPALLESLASRQLSARSMTLGSHHSAMIAMNGELYTWGSNLQGCLGHAIRDKYVEHTAEPGHVSGFGAIVQRVGRGTIRSLALGREFTLCATYPYQGPGEEVARRLMQEEAIRLEELAMEEEEREREQQSLLASTIAEQRENAADTLFLQDDKSAGRRGAEAPPQTAGGSSVDRDVGKMLTKGMVTTKHRSS